VSSATQLVARQFDCRTLAGLNRTVHEAEILRHFTLDPNKDYQPQGS
jgi:hypothetical protein